MASNVVRVEMAEAERGVNNFNAKLDELNNKIKALRARVNETATWWEGDTGTSFRDSFDRACSFFETTLTRKLTDHAQRMLASVRAQHTQDTDMSAQIKRH